MIDSARLEAIEVKLAHLERAVSDISDVVVRQQMELQQVLVRQQRLNDQLSILQVEHSASATTDEKPPHY